MIPHGMIPGVPGGGGPPPPQLVQAILSHMGRPGPGGPGPGAAAGPPPDENGKGMSPLEHIQSLIQDIHDSMRNIQDPQIINVLAGCLKAVTGVQQQLMAQQGGK